MFFIISIFMTGLSLYCMVWVISKPALQAPMHNKTINNSLALKLVWPWVFVLRPFCEPFISWRLRAKLEHHIQRAGIHTFWLPAHWVALQLVIFLFSFAISFVAFFIWLDWPLIKSIFWSVLLAALAGWLPYQHILSMARARQLSMLRELPFLLDMTTLCVEAGLNLHGALQQAALYGPSGPMRSELNHALADIRAGVTKLDALNNMAKRTDLAEVVNLVASLAQADQMGASLGPLLRAQSDQRRSERFLRAEEQALKAPVKMLFPMVMCIFPCTFLIIGFPIVNKLLVSFA